MPSPWITLDTLMTTQNCIRNVASRKCRSGESCLYRTDTLQVYTRVSFIHSQSLDQVHEEVMPLCDCCVPLFALCWPCSSWLLPIKPICQALPLGSTENTEMSTCRDKLDTPWHRVRTQLCNYLRFPQTLWQVLAEELLCGACMRPYKEPSVYNEVTVFSDLV